MMQSSEMLPSAKEIEVEVIIRGRPDDPEVCYQGDCTDVTGSMDFRDICGNVLVTLQLKTQLGLRFSQLLTSNTPFKRPQPHPKQDSDKQFRNVSVEPTVISFDYANNNARPFHIYGIGLVDEQGQEFVLDPYIRNGGGGAIDSA
jgi:hypothetical protein